MCRIVHRHQIRSFRLCRCGGKRPVFCRQKFCNPALWLVTGTYFHKTADNVPYHMMYKGIRFDVHHHICTITGDVNMHHVAPRGTRLALYRTKRGEIILSQQTLSGALHPLRIQRQIIMGYAAAQYRRPQTMIIDNITIATRRGAEAGVKILRNRLHPAHRNVAG